MDEAERREIERQVRATAQRRVRTKLGFAWHFALFLLINGALFAINRAYSPNTLWFVWPLAGWGLAVALHGFAAFQGNGISADMLQAEIRREMARRGLS